MRILTRKIPAHTVRSYQCETCHTKYSLKNLAEQCEARKLEKKEFEKGDRVQAKEKRRCYVQNKDFLLKGTVVAVEGPMPSDFEYEVKCLGGVTARVRGHVYLYTVEYDCPCGRKRGHQYYTPEITKIRSKTKSR